MLGKEGAMPNEVVLIVKHVTSGGADVPHTDTGEIVEVIQDGETRTPANKDFGVACFWLQRHGYKPTGFKWIDRTGLIRRRRCTYAREA
jgi:hypothetical protein